MKVKFVLGTKRSVVWISPEMLMAIKMYANSHDERVVEATNELLTKALKDYTKERK